MKRFVALALLCLVCVGCGVPSQPPMFSTGDIVVPAETKPPTNNFDDAPLGLVITVTSANNGAIWLYHVAYQGGQAQFSEQHLRKVGHLDWTGLCQFCKVPIVITPTPKEAPKK